MTNEIIFDVGYNENRVAFLEDGDLAELIIEPRQHKEIVGNIYRGRVENVLPGMRAAFVDIGLDRNAFLYLGDVLYGNDEYSGQENGLDNTDMPRTDVNQIIRTGQEIIVQVIKGTIGTKGPRVTTNITLPGRALVLVPETDYIYVSRRIEDEDEKRRLTEIAEKVKPEGKGLIIRTVAVEAQEKDFERDVKMLMKTWAQIEKRMQKAGGPGIIYEDFNLPLKIARDVLKSDISRFVVNDKQQYEEILEFLSRTSPKLKSRVEYFTEDDDIFEHYGIKPQVDRAIVRRVWLKCGGYLVIDQAEALTVIDVNTGKFVGNHTLEDTILKTNIDAAEEIAKQLRLRDIGGIIIIDFIDMHSEEHKNMVLERLTESLKKDRTKTAVIGFTSLGLVEMTRKKVRENLAATLNTECTHCKGTGRVLSQESVVRDIERKIINYFKSHKVDSICIEVNPGVLAGLLGADGQNIKNMEKIYKKNIEVSSSSELKYSEVKIY